MKMFKLAKTEYPIITLTGETEEILRFEQNGDIFIHNKLVVNDMEVVEGFREFLTGQGLVKGGK